MRKILLLLIAFSGLWLCAEIKFLAQGLPIDDAYIFKRYSVNLAEGAGFSFNPDEPSLGCSSFLWAVLLAGLVKIFGKESYYLIAQWSGMIFTMLGIWLLLKMILKHTQGLLTVLAGGFFAWFSSITFMNSISGMENGLFAFLVMTNIYYFDESQKPGAGSGFKLGILAGLAFLTRPEGIYFLIAMIIIWFFSLFRKERISFSWIFFYLIGFALMGFPYLYWLKHHFHQWLPYTYLAKIYSTDPGFLERSFERKIFDGANFLVYGWWLIIKPWKIVGILVFLSAIIGLFYALWGFFRKDKEWSLTKAGGWLFLPFVYGYSFPVPPHFGGYYQRYISSVWLVMILLSIVGMDKIYNQFFARFKLLKWSKGLIYLIGLILAIIYCYPIVSGQIKEGKKVYCQEVQLNEGLRMDSAKYLASHTKPEAKILVGYTGLGVVGGEADRYIYDLGALINLDLLPYLKGTMPMTEKRWSRILDYICDKKIDYYVSFAPILGPDPAIFPGFLEIARFSSAPKPKEPIQEIRVYIINRVLLCGERKTKEWGER